MSQLGEANSVSPISLHPHTGSWEAAADPQAVPHPRMGSLELAPPTSHLQRHRHISRPAAGLVALQLLIISSLHPSPDLLNQSPHRQQSWPDI